MADGWTMDLSPELAGAFSGEQRARVLGAFYVFGGIVGALNLLAGSWPGAHVAGLAALTLATGLAGAVMVRWPAHVPRWVCHAVVGSGSVVIALCIYLAGGGAASATFQLYYVWTTLYVFLFYGAAVRAAHTAFSAVCLSVALVWLGEADHLGSSLVITLGTSLGAGMIVGHLMSQVRTLASTDALTGAPNRRAAEQMLGAALGRARRSGEPLSLALLDLDDFKELNDAFGHAIGDQVLRDAVVRWNEELRAPGTLARLGGDEFLVVLERCVELDALAVAGRLVNATPGSVGCSAGVAHWDGTESCSDLVRRCDAALYRAKAEEGGNVVRSTPIVT
jgi:diguanylate cyclase (GGDEF)-like protein